jgi:transposase-like protein
MQNCPKCASSETVKNGHHLGRQRYRCKACRFQFTRQTPRGRPANEKAMAILLYTLGISFNAIARIYGVATSTVMRWVRVFAEKTYEKPEPGQAVIVELDEMWHYLHSKKTHSGSGKLIVAIPVSSLTGNVAIATRTLLRN